VDEVFRALNDPCRRLLLDRLFAEDGQTLVELSRHLPGMTRFGVMNHLRVLEEAGLVVPHKVGRNKHHYLNPVPIRQVQDRWISKYTAPWAGALTGLKAHLEGGSTPMSGPVHIYQVYIGCKVNDAWQALVDGEQTKQYFYGTKVQSEWTEGSEFRYLYADGTVAADGTVVLINPPNRLEMIFHPRWDPEIERGGPARMVWRIEEANGATRLTVELCDLAPGSLSLDEFVGGLPMIVSGLKTLLETGRPLLAIS
jgi:uncharacterized protein YndB with AHSA1/START domain/DNA-binding transcriptional ArsR family regulator